MTSKIQSSRKKPNPYIPTAEFYSQVIESLQDYAILTLDPDLFITSWSSGAVQLFGYQAEEAIGQTFALIFTQEDRENDIPQLEIDRTLEDGRSVDNRWHQSKDGSLFYAYGLVFPLTGKDGEFLGFVKILRDLTVRKQADDAINKYIRELEELNTHKENILAILSHDLRSPLVGMLGIVGFLKNDYDTLDSDEVKQMLGVLQKSAKKELDMLDYLVKWARIKYASEAFSPIKTKLLKHVKNVFETLQDLAESRQILLEHKIKADIEVFADEKMLRSIVQNLVSNAIKNSHQGGKVTVTASSRDKNIVVEIRDKGVGMTSEMQKKLFTPQMTSMSQDMQTSNGAGIGLLLVKGFLKKNNGDIWVKSQKGKGSTFFFSLPKNKIDEDNGEINHTRFNEKTEG
jgi:PAS domain S-box-containing protein